MLASLINIYVFLFARARFSRLNFLLYRLSLAGLGVLNYKTSKLSGESAFLKSFLSNKRGVVIDVGANQGGYTKRVLSVSSEINVFAFEPHPKTFSTLKKEFADCERVVLIKKGLSAEQGVIKLYDYPDIDGSEHASIFKEVITEIHGAGAAISNEVELITLDDFIISENISEIELLKVDTEGNELQVLRGAATAISERKVKAIHFEFNEMNVVSRVFFRDFWNILENYRFYRLLPNEFLEIKNYNALNCEIFAYQNIVAILKD